MHACVHMYWPVYLCVHMVACVAYVCISALCVHKCGAAGALNGWGSGGGGSRAITSLFGQPQHIFLPILGNPRAKQKNMYNIFGITLESRNSRQIEHEAAYPCAKHACLDVLVQSKCHDISRKL